MLPYQKKEEGFILESGRRKNEETLVVLEL